MRRRFTPRREHIDLAPQLPPRLGRGPRNLLPTCQGLVACSRLYRSRCRKFQSAYRRPIFRILPSHGRLHRRPLQPVSPAMRACQWRVLDNKYSQTLLAVHVTLEEQALVLKKRARLAKQERDQPASKDKNENGGEVHEISYDPLKRQEACLAIEQSATVSLHGSDTDSTNSRKTRSRKQTIERTVLSFLYHESCWP